MADEKISIGAWQKICSDRHNALDDLITEKNKHQDHQIALFREQTARQLDRIATALHDSIRQQFSLSVSKETFKNDIRNILIGMLNDDILVDLLGKSHNEIREIISERMTEIKVKTLVTTILDNPEQQDLMKKKLSLGDVVKLIAVIFIIGTIWATTLYKFDSLHNRINKLEESLSYKAKVK